MFNFSGWNPRSRWELTIASFFVLAILGAISGCTRQTAEVLTPNLEITERVQKTSPDPTDHGTGQITETQVVRTSVKPPLAEYIAEREALVEHAVAVQYLENNDVIRALGSVPRHQFVLSELQDKAYEDTALPIGYGQTISQPSLVAYMTELLELKPGKKVLEIGTGSGYQAAILAELGYVEVYSIEIVPELYERASQLLDDLGYKNVKIKQGDGYYGWLDYAPFDAIIVTAAPDHLPGPLAEQLAEGGIMVIPIGPQGWYQTLWKFVKVEGELIAYNQGPVSFVPFTGEGIEDATPEP